MCLFSYQMPVSQLVLSERLFLKKLLGAKNPQTFQKVISNATTGQILVLVEIALNLLKGRANLNNDQKSLLRKHANLLREIASTRSEKKARSLIIQRGGSLPLTAILVPVLIEIAKSLISK